MPDWARIFPDADHRWAMGLRPASAAEFFAPIDDGGDVCRERAQWLADNPERYAALPTEAEPALRDTLRLARELGVEIDQGLSPLEQMLALGRLWEPDFVWMRPDDAGTHRLIGGVLCFASSWDLREKLGRPITEIHSPVPGLNEILARQIETFLSRLTPGAAWTRENANYSRDALLNHHPSRVRRRLDATVTPGEFFIRLEHQLLMRLFPSGDILFGIRLEIVPVAEVLRDPQATAGLARALTTISPAAAAYKGIAEARPTLVALLQRGSPLP
jgi:hypothetical protein